MKPSHNGVLVRQGGFSLLELMVAITIVGVLMGAGMKLALSQIQRAQAESTKQTLEAVRNALSAHVARAGFLPCPASREALPGTAEFGTPTDCTDLATVGIGECGAGYCIQAGRLVDDDSNPATPDVPLRVRIGAVPARALNVPFDIMADGWGNQVSYAVTEVLAQNPTSYDAFDGGIAVIDESGHSVITPPETAQYVLVSHGNDRVGATSFLGGALVQPCPAGGAFAPKDQENCNFDDDPAVFRTALFSQSDGPSHFDDAITYVTSIEPAAGAETVDDSNAFGKMEIVGTVRGGSDVACQNTYGEGSHIMRSSEISKVAVFGVATGHMFCDELAYYGEGRVYCPGSTDMLNASCFTPLVYVSGNGLSTKCLNQIWPYDVSKLPFLCVK